MGQGVQTRYDSKGQYERVLPQLLEGEALYSVFDLKDSGSGFVAATDRRLIFMDQNFLDRQDMALVTIPYARRGYVAIQTERKILGRDSSSVTIAVTDQTFEFIFHGADKARRLAQLVNLNICT